MAIVVMSSPITRHRKPHLQKPDRNIPNPTFGVRFISCTLPILRSDCILSSWCFGFEVVQESWTLEWERSPLVARYTREQRLRAVRVYERYDRSAASVINELGYPSRGMLAQWHRAWVEAGRDGGGSLGDGRGGTLHVRSETRRRRSLSAAWAVSAAHPARAGVSEPRGVGALGRRAGAGTAQVVARAGGRADGAAGGGGVCVRGGYQSPDRRGAGRERRRRAKLEAHHAFARRQGARDA